MATALPNRFQKYELSEEELKNAKILSMETRWWLQTRRTEIIEQKLLLDPLDKEFIQHEAANRGAITLLTEILGD